MRTTVFLSTLFAVTLLGGAALADKPQAAATPVKVPRSIEKLRVHGDVVDKAYRGPSAATPQAREVQQAAPSRQQARRPTLGDSRIYCSEMGADCARPRAEQKASVVDQGAAKGERNVRPPASLDKVLGSDRMHCNEADECSMSSRAVKRAWSRAAAEGTAAAAGAVGAPDAKESQLAKIRTQRAKPEARMSCNEAGECSMDPKAVAREWAKASIKAGTFKAPEQASPTPAEVAITRARNEKK